MRVSVTKLRPMPKPNSTIGPSTPETYELSVRRKASQVSPIPTRAVPVSMNGFGPRRGRKRCERPAAVTMATVTGRKPSPDWIGVKPSTFCTNWTMKKNMPNIAAARLSMIT